MFARTSDRSPCRVLLLLVAVLAGAALVAGQPARAQEGAKAETSLTLVPEDAAFYMTCLRNKEQFDLFYKSNAYKALRALPLVQEAWKKAKEEMSKGGGPLEHYEKLSKSKEGKEIIDLVLDSLSHEVFIYGGKGFGDFFHLLGQARTAQWAAFPVMFRNPFDANKAQARSMLRAMLQSRDKIKAPDLIIGFKVKDPKRLVAHLDGLEKMATKMAEGQPALKGRFKREKVAGGEFLALELDGSLLPADAMAAGLKEVEEKEGEFKPLLDHLKKTKLTFSVGVKGNYILVGLTGTIKEMEKLGVKGKTLADRAEMKPLAKFAEKKLTSIGYTSQEFLRSAAASQGDLGTLGAALKEMLAGAPAVKDERKKAIGKDIDALAQSLRTWAPDPGAQMSFSFRTGNGWESYTHNYTRNEALKAVRLNLHNHFGGNPIFAAAFGCNLDGQMVAGLIKWVKTIHGHAEAVFLDSADDDAKDTYKKIMGGVQPLLKRLEDNTTNMMVPALARSGLGIVIDGKWSSKQWVTNAPATDKAMPMLELGLLVGTNDGGRFADAMREYRTIFNDIWAKVRELAPPGADIPEFRIPPPQSEKAKDGTLYFYTLPPDAGLDKQVQPTMGAAKDVATLTLSKKHAERLLARTPLKATTGPLARKGNLLGVCYLDWPAFVDAVAPWVEFGINTHAPAGEAEKVLKQVGEVVKILKAFKGVSSATYLEGDTVVTHTESVFKDIDAAAEAK